MILIAPIRTEKAVSSMEFASTLTFKVADTATKADVKKAVEETFKVKVDAVRTYTTMKGGKRARVKLAKGFKADDIAAKLKMI